MAELSTDGEPERVINVGVSGPGVVAAAIRRAGDCDLTTLAETIKGRHLR